MQRINKAFIMVEMLLTLFITTIAFSLSYNITTINYDDYYFINDFHYQKAKALANHETTNVHHKLNFNHPIYFNEYGNINMAQSTYTSRGKITIYLGSGYLIYEK